MENLGPEGDIQFQATAWRGKWWPHAMGCVFLALAIVTGAYESKAIASAKVTSILLNELEYRISLRSSPDPPVGDANSPRITPDRPGNHYLMLVNTAVAFEMDAQKMAQFDRSPYDGVAVSFWHAYDASPIHSVQDMDAQIAGWKKATKKDIWPWVYVNRMLGTNLTEENDHNRVPYFMKFQGLDLDNKAGARSDFLDNWRNSLHAAKDTGAPGVVCDLEFYNDSKSYDPGELARLTGHSIPETLKLLRQLGADMADSSAAEYPGATLWFLFTGFTRVSWKVIEGQPYYPAATYIAEGLLDQIQKRHLPVHVVSGGETGLGYCHDSTVELQRQIEWRAGIYAPLLQKYSGILELAGTMTVWSDRSAKRGWMTQGSCGSTPEATVEDLEPYMELLFRTYRFNWIYGSGTGGYFAFQNTSAPRFDAAIAQAQSRAYGALTK